MTSVIHICAPNSAYKGLGWNAWHTTNVLREQGISADWCQCVPQDIVYQIQKHQPKVAVIMAVWVPVDELAKLAECFPQTTFIVKNHSGPQFLAQEGKSWSNWLKCGDLSAKFNNVRLAVIRPEHALAVNVLGVPCASLPNVYSSNELQDALKRNPARPESIVNIGLFGAFRPMKNGVGSALAIARASQVFKAGGKSVSVHTNQRLEMGSACDLDIATDILSRAGVSVVKHSWLDHADFVALASQMNACVCASFEETYNYVAADCVTARSPVVGTKAIWWLPPNQQVNPDSTTGLATAIVDAVGMETDSQLKHLVENDKRSRSLLLETLEGFGVRKSEGETR